jgi:hypothetical protein
MNKYLFIILLFGVSCGQNKTHENSVKGDKQSEGKTENKVKIAIFNDVAGTRAKLSTAGIGDLGKWRDDEMGGFMSITNYYTFGDNKLNNLAYYLESDNSDYVTTLKLVLNINNMSEKRPALTKLAEVVEKTFTVLSLELPKELVKSLKAERSVFIDQKNFTTELKLERSKIETWIVKVTTKK